MKNLIGKLSVLVVTLGLLITSALVVKAADGCTITVNVANAVDVDGNPITSTTYDVPVGVLWSSPNYYPAPGYQLPKEIIVGGVSYKVSPGSSWISGVDIEQYNNWVRFEFTPNADTTATVELPGIDYNIAFDPNGGSGTIPNVSAVYGEPATLPSEGFTREEWEMTGWNTQPDGSGDTYELGGTAQDLTTVDGETVTLYAMWGQSIGLAADKATVEMKAPVGYKSANAQGVHEDIKITSIGSIPITFVVAGFKDASSYEQFSVMAGGMDVTVYPKEGLPAGKYTAIIVIMDFDGEVEPLEIPVTFIVEESTPPTSDYTNIALWSSLFGLSIFGFLMSIKAKRMN